MRSKLLLLLLGLVLVAACSNGHGEGAQPAERREAEATSEAPDGEAGEASSEGPEDGVFRGTAVERTEAMMLCYERMGIAVDPLPDDPRTFRVDPGLMSREEQRELRQACIDELGEWTQESFPDGYVRQHYDHRLWQRECLMELGYSLAEPPSFEAFQEGMEWDPLGDVVSAVGLRPPQFLEVRDQCPYFHQWEAQQSGGDD